MEQIGIKVGIGADGEGKGAKLCEKFVKQASKIDATPEDVATAIAILQLWFFEEFGCLPISDKLLDAVNKASIYEMREA